MINKDNSYNDGITYNEMENDRKRNDKYGKVIDDRRRAMMTGSFSNMKAWVYQTRKQGVPDQTPRDYTNGLIDEEMKKLLEKGPKHVVITLKPDFYEMHEMYRKMERIMTGRWYMFCKINKYNDNEREKRWNELEEILNNEIADDDEYDNPHIPKQFKEKNDNIPCNNQIILEFLREFRKIWFNMENMLNIKNIYASCKKIVDRDKNE